MTWLDEIRINKTGKIGVSSKRPITNVIGLFIYKAVLEFSISKQVVLRKL